MVIGFIVHAQGVPEEHHTGAAAIASEIRGTAPDVRLAHNPEFTREAVAVKDFLAPDRVVIGVDGHDDGGRGTEVADALRAVYAPLDAPVVVTDLTSAETIKVARLAVQTGCFLMQEIVEGERRYTHKIGKRKPIEEYLKYQARFKHVIDDPEALAAAWGKMGRR